MLSALAFRRSWLLPAFSLALLAACGGDDPAQGGAGGGDVVPQFDYPLDDVLRIQHLQAKATHNSYHIENEGSTVEAWDYTHVPLAEQLASQAVRGVELDTHYDEAEGVFYVYHLPAIDEQSTCRLFTDCLRELKSWSDAHRAHHPLFVHVEPKSGYSIPVTEDYIERFEAEVRSVWPESRLVTPALVQGSAPTLAEALAGRGFPTLGETRGRALFYLDDDSDVRDAYTRGGKSLDGRLAFVDSDPGDPFGGVAILNDPIGDADAIAKALAAGFLVRTGADPDAVGLVSGDTTFLTAALASGAQLITTDYPVPVSGKAFFVEIPGGTPSRCNPVTAVDGCTAEAVEDPAFVGD